MYISKHFRQSRQRPFKTVNASQIFRGIEHLGAPTVSDALVGALAIWEPASIGEQTYKATYFFPRKVIWGKMKSKNQGLYF